MGILTQFKDEDNELIKYWNEHDNENEWEYKKKPPKEAIDLNTYIREEITQYGIYLSMFDLETDLAKSSIKNILKEYYGKKRENSLIKAMQTHKAKNMMDFLSENVLNWEYWREDDISKPLIALRSSVEERIHQNMINEPTNEQKAILNYNGNTVVTANPGSGKTYTVVEK